VPADRAAARSRSRPKIRKLDRSPRLREHVLARIGGSWSPQQVAVGLKTEPVSGEGGPVTVSHQAIYDWIYARPKGELRELAARQVALRSGRTSRRPKTGQPPAKRVRIAGMTSIDQRPPEVADRRVPGHWEGDRATWKVARSEWLCRLEVRLMEV